MRAYHLHRRGKAVWTHHGKVAVVTCLLASAAVQGGLSYAANLVWPGLRDPLYFDKVAKLRRRVAEQPASGGRPLTVVMYGSSRTQMGLDGMTFEGILAERVGRPVVALNLGIPAAGPITSAINIRRTLRADHRPDVILIEVTLPLLAGQYPVPHECHFLQPERFLSDEIPLALDFGYPAEDTRSRWWLSSLVPSYGLRFPLLGRVAPRWRAPAYRSDAGRVRDPTGWAPFMAAQVSPEEYRRGVERAWQEYENLFRGMRLDGHPVHALGAGLRYCRDCGLTPTLVLMPEGSDFRSWYPPASVVEARALLAGLAEEYGALQIDAREWLADDAFIDSHHLRSSGATEFSRRLARALVPPIDPGEVRD